MPLKTIRSEKLYLKGHKIVTNYSEKKTANIKLAQLIIYEYQTTKSFSEIAKKLNTNKVVVQRILITEGLWSSRRTKQVAELKDQGLSVKEIAAQLEIDERTILTYLPYRYGKYGQTDLTGRILTQPEAIDIRGVLEDSNESNVSVLPGAGSVFRLKLELIDQFSRSKKGSLGMDPEKKEFLRLAEAREGIIREVLAPGEMNLHAFHYMIQSLFGWLNGHLHNFSLSESEFRLLTGSKVGGWENLCGCLLHFPSGDDSDMFWDDDYRSGQNVKTWYKRKYTGPYAQKALCETYYITTRIELKQFFARYSHFTSDMTIDEMENLADFEEPLNFLNERLTLNELMVKHVSGNEFERRKAYQNWLEVLRQKKIKTDILIDGLSRKELIELNDAIGGLKQWRSNLAHVEQMLAFDREDELIELTGSTAAEWIGECKTNILKLERRCKKLFDDYNPKLNPLFNTLYYDYDYDSGWRVKITVVDRYDANTPVKESDGVSRVLIDQVNSKLSPRCIALDGVNVLDDVGGIDGFHELLAALKADESEEKERAKSKVNRMGWKATIEKPEDVL